MKRWYVVQVYAGQEEVAKTDLMKRIEEQTLQEFFGQILVPSAKMKQFFGVVDSPKDHQLFPGYLLTEMEAVPEAIKAVSSSMRVLRFLESPLSKKEVDRVLAQMTGEVKLPSEKHEFEVKEEVEIKEGPFAGFVGIIDRIQEEDKKLTVMVSIFGRMTPVELRFDQVKH
jgi:transcription termination/antitermination protein NusG